MAMRTVAFQANVTKTLKLTAPKSSISRVPLRSSRPATLQSEFLIPAASLKGLCSSFAQMVLDPVRRAASGIRLPLLVEANRKKGLGATLYGTRRKRARVSGFRARMATPGGRRVIAARRKRGRKNLTPGKMPVRK